MGSRGIEFGQFPDKKRVFREFRDKLLELRWPRLSSSHVAPPAPVRSSQTAAGSVALVSGMLVQKDNLLVILARCRAKGIRTVVGGPIASGFGELHRYADHVVIGEAEELIAPLAEDLERGAAKPHYKASKMPSLDCSPLPDLSLINTRHYCSMAIQYSRGCPYNCEFCDIRRVATVATLPSAFFDEHFGSLGRCTTKSMAYAP